jgi:putative transposase
MKRIRYTSVQIILKLKTVDQLIAQGKTVADYRAIEVTQPTFHHWTQQYWGMYAEEAKRLTQPEIQTARLKKLLAKAELEKAMLKELPDGNFRARNDAAGLLRPYARSSRYRSGSLSW